MLDNNVVTYIVGSRRDITELKRLESEKENLLSRLQSMFSEHNASMLIIEPKSGKIIDANPAACAFYGYDKEEFLNLYIQDINLLPKEEVARRLEMAFGHHQKYFVFPHKLKNGEVRLVDVYSCPITYGEETQLFSIIFDVTDRETYRQNLSREKELLNITLRSIGDGVVTTDTEGRITSINDASQEITGWDEEEAKNKPFTEVFRLHSEIHENITEDPVAEVLKTGNKVELANHTVLINKEGKAVPVADSAAPIKDEQGNIFGVVMVLRDVSRDRAQKKQIIYLSYHDYLTNLHNRRFFEEQMTHIDTEENLPIAVIMGDVNGLKITNDVFGHEAGDQILLRVADAFRETCRSDDVLARWGGDEFLMLLPHTGPQEAELRIKRILEKCADKCKGILQISVSLGYSVKDSQDEDLHHVLQEAEEWMYHQKLLEGKSYRNTIVNTLLSTLYEKSMETQEHAERLRDYCHAIGRKLNLSEKDINELSLLAVLHDIGKVAINQGILQKPGPLTPEEWEEMKKHSEIGYRIAHNTPELSVVAEYILSHHERWDGKGYPRGLEGDGIPLLCRILSVTDAYDAMTSDRVYRKAVCRKEAAEELLKNAGTQFDKDIVGIFIDILNKD